MYFKLAIEILVAFFAVIGFYDIVRWIAQRLFGSKNSIIAVKILTQRDAESAEVLIRDALFGYLSLPSGTVIVLTTPELVSTPELCRALSFYGVSCFVIEDEDTNI